MIAFYMAWQMFLWIPCPVHKWDQGKQKAMLLWMPVIGLMIGLLWFGVFFLCSLMKVGPIPAALIAIFPWLVTGFMHLDGYMDCADGALYFGSRERKLEILKDSHVGSFAVIAMVILGIMQFASAFALVQKEINIDQASALIFIPAITRALSVTFVMSCDPLPKSSYQGLKAHVRNIDPALSSAMIVVMLAAIGFVSGINYAFAVLIALAIETVIILYLKKNLGGISGDISGAAITAGELACIIALAYA